MCSLFSAVFISTVHVHSYLGDEYNAMKGGTLSAEQLAGFTNEWTIQVRAPKDLPEQTDGVNCGAFVCMFAHYILLKQVSVRYCI